jgi:hypothetical protein
MRNLRQIHLILFLFNTSLVCNGENIVHPRLYLSPNYSIHDAPIYPKEGPLHVNFTINLNNILEVDEVDHLISLETSVRMYWKDRRVKVNPREGEDYLSLNSRATKHFWIPDIFIDRSKDVRVPSYYVKPATLRIYPDQTMRYSSRINFDVDCEMDFHRYPMDEQLCKVKFESFGYTTKQLKFDWLTGNKNHTNNVNPDMELSQFKVDVYFAYTYQTEHYDLSYPGMLKK